MISETTIEIVEERATQNEEYYIHQDKVIEQLKYLNERLNSEGIQALRTLEEELSLAQGVAIRLAYLQGVEIKK